MNNFWNAYPAIQENLEQVKAIMLENIKCGSSIIETPLRDLIYSGGKLLRPGFLLLSGSFGEFDKEKLCSLGAVVEMLHMATLIHDDIIDEAETRRGKLTVQNKYGKSVAVYMGDFLFSKCFTTLSVTTSTDNMKLLSNAVNQICIGEIEQYSSKFSLDISVKKYLKRIARKTASLFAMSFYVGAEESNCQNNLSKNLAKIGYDIGMAFQIIDDILDYTSTENIIGKPVGNDLKEGFYTLPLIYALKSDENSLHLKLLNNLISKQIYDESDIEEIIKLTTSLGGLEKSKQLAHRYTSRAFERIAKLPVCESKEILGNVTSKLLNRNY